METHVFLPLSLPLCLALFISCVSISCLYGIRRLEYSASCVSPRSEGEDFRLWADSLSEGKGAVGLLPNQTARLAGSCLSQSTRPIITVLAAQPSLPPTLSLINRYQTDLAGHIGPGLSWPIRTRTLYIFSLLTAHRQTKQAFFWASLLNCMIIPNASDGID